MAYRKKPSLTWIQCNEAIERIHNPNEAEPADIQRISAWLWLNRKLYERAKKEWQDYGQAPPLGCSCSPISGEYRMFGLFGVLEEITELYQKELFFKGIVERFSLIDNNPDEISKWLKNNYSRALKTTDLLGMNLWDDNVVLNKKAYPVSSVFYREKGVYVKGEEFSNALNFLKIYEEMSCHYDFPPE